MTDSGSTRRQPVVLGPGEGRAYPMGRISAVFKADGAETGQLYSISEWCVVVPGHVTHDFENRGTERAGVLNVSAPGTSASASGTWPDSPQAGRRPPFPIASAAHVRSGTMADMQVADVRKLIDGLRWDRRRHPYSGRREYAQRAQSVAAAVADMIEAGDAESARPLARRAVERVTAALMYMDDSAGIVGDDLRTLMALYARACRAASPDARRLARWLVSMQLDGPGWPAIELKEFADALGPRGLAEVARLTEERGVTAEPDSWSGQWGIKDLREQLAAVSGDIDAHVAVLTEDLRGAHRYGEIVEVLRAAGLNDDAEQWARNGLAEHPSGFQTDRLRDQLVDLLLDARKAADAVAIRRELYERRTIHQEYLKLRQAAQQAGQWADLSGWALNLLRGRAHADQRYVTELISVLVGENLVDEAWTAAMSNPGQVPESQWFQLIEMREQDHPTDVIRPYQDLIEIGLEKASDKYRYPKAIKTIRRLRDSYHRTGDEAGFTAYVADLRERHRRKTSFVAKLDKALGRH